MPGIGQSGLDDVVIILNRQRAKYPPVLPNQIFLFPRLERITIIKDNPDKNYSLPE
jgi:hypothetical protein